MREQQQAALTAAFQYLSFEERSIILELTQGFAANHVKSKPQLRLLRGGRLTNGLVRSGNGAAAHLQNDLPLRGVCVLVSPNEID